MESLESFLFQKSIINVEISWNSVFQQLLNVKGMSTLDKEAYRLVQLCCHKLTIFYKLTNNFMFCIQCWIYKKPQNYLEFAQFKEGYMPPGPPEFGLSDRISNAFSVSLGSICTCTIVIRTFKQMLILSVNRAWDLITTYHHILLEVCTHMCPGPLTD